MVTETHVVGIVAVGLRRAPDGSPVGKRYLAGCSCTWSHERSLPREEAVARAMEHHRESNGAPIATRSTTPRKATDAGTSPR